MLVSEIFSTGGGGGGGRCCGGCEHEHREHFRSFRRHEHEHEGGFRRRGRREDGDNLIELNILGG